MTTFAALQDAERELDERTAASWTEYNDQLRELDGKAYAIAESAAWEHLQTTLGELREQRLDLATPGHRTRDQT